MDTYACYADLASAEREGIDYEIVARPVAGAQVAVIAPHGGGIEPKTDAIAAAIAGTDFSYYSFRGRKPKNNGKLHITSQRFDEPDCVSLIARHPWVVAIHGCDEPGEKIFLGGLDAELIGELAAELRRIGISVATTGHDYSGTHTNNICNRGLSAKGVQIELTLALRNSPELPALIEGVRSVLLNRCRAISS